MAKKPKTLPDLSSRGISPDEPDASGRTRAKPTPEQARRLAVRHGFPPDFELSEPLDECWFWWRVDVESGPPPTGAMRRDLLRELTEGADLLAEAIPKLALMDRAAIRDAAPRMNLEALTQSLRRLSSASRTAMQKVRASKPGAHGRVETIELLCKLWRTYRDAFGHDAAHVTRMGTLYSGKFFDFANDTLRLFGAPMSNGALGKAIQKAQRAVKASDARAAMP